MSTPEHYWEDLRLKKVQVSNGEHCCKLLVKSEYVHTVLNGHRNHKARSEAAGRVFMLWVWLSQKTKISTH